MKEILFLLLDILWFLLIANVILSWLIVAGVRNDIVRQIYSASNQLLDPILRPIRRVVPPIGMIDITPLIAFILIIVVRQILNRIL